MLQTIHINCVTVKQKKLHFIQCTSLFLTVIFLSFDIQLQQKKQMKDWLHISGQYSFQFSILYSYIYIYMNMC